MRKKKYIVRYMDEDNENVKTFGVNAFSKRNATNIVISYIEDKGLHPSINYGFSLYAKESNKIADYEIPDINDNNLTPTQQKKHNKLWEGHEDGKV